MMLSVVLNYLRNHVRSLVVVSFILADLLANYYLDFENSPVKERCSPKFPEFANRIERFVTLTDGSIRVESGEVYPIGTFWTDGRVIWGCPCIIRQCVSKCCPLGQAFNRDHQCVFVDRPFQITDQLKVYHDEGETMNLINVTHNHFSILINKCAIRVNHKESEDLSLLDDGNVWDNDSETYLNPSEYCIDDYSENYMDPEGLPITVKCLTSEKQDREKDITFWYWIFTYFLKTFAVILNLVTISVFAVVPQLRRGYGKSIMCYVLSAAITCTAEALSWTYYVYQSHDVLCTVIVSAPVTWLSRMSTQNWQMFVSMDIWALFKAGSVNVHDIKDSTGFKRFLIHCALAWGIPLALISVPLAGHLIPGSPEYLQPHWNEQFGCYWSNEHLLWICAIIPNTLAVVVPMVICVVTLRHLQAGKKTSDEGDSQVHGSKLFKWSSLYVKVYLLMGVSFIVAEIFSLMTWTTEFRD